MTEQLKSTGEPVQKKPKIQLEDDDIDYEEEERRYIQMLEEEERGPRYAPSLYEFNKRRAQLKNRNTKK
jgi:hypothetical protein